MHRKRLLLALLLAGALCAAALAVILARLRVRPDWYAPVAGSDAAAQAAAAVEAERFEYDLAVELQRIRPTSAAWTLELSDADVNAWLATRLDDWLVQQGAGPWPRELGVPQVRTTPEGMWMGVPIHVGTGAFAQARLVPRLDGDALVLELEDAALGGFAYDRADEALADIASTRGAEGVASVGLDPEALRHGEVRGDPVLPLADGRRARIESIALGDGAIVLTLRTIGKGE